MESVNKRSPLPKQYISPVSGKVIRPHDISEREPVQDRRALEYQVGDEARALYEQRTAARNMGEPMGSFSEALDRGDSFGGNGAKPVHTQDSVDFLKRKRFHTAPPGGFDQ